jgi:hypothetical protein
MAYVGRSRPVGTANLKRITSAHLSHLLLKEFKGPAFALEGSDRENAAVGVAAKGVLSASSQGIAFSPVLRYLNKLKLHKLKLNKLAIR